MSSIPLAQDGQQNTLLHTNFPPTISTYINSAAISYLDTRPPMDTLTYSSYPMNLSLFSLEGGGHR